MSESEFRRIDLRLKVSEDEKLIKYLDSAFDQATALGANKSGVLKFMLNEYMKSHPRGLDLFSQTDTPTQLSSQPSVEEIKQVDENHELSGEGGVKQTASDASNQNDSETQDTKTNNPESKPKTKADSINKNSDPFAKAAENTVPANKPTSNKLFENSNIFG